jgi:hypothetical protein
VVVLIVMGVAVVLFGIALLLWNRESGAAPLVEALGLDGGPASVALLLVVGAAMVGLGAYPIVVPWARQGTAVASTPGAPIVKLGVIPASTGR